MVKLKNILTSLNFFIGLFCGALFVWGLFVREPFLTSQEDKGSYAYGQQIGRNLKNGFVDYNSRIFKMGMDHAAQDYSQLETSELQASLNYLSEKSRPLRREAQTQNSPQPTPSEVDDYGFVTTPFHFSYFKTNWEKFDQIRKMKGFPKKAEANSSAAVDFNQIKNDPDLVVEFELNFYDLKKTR
jgi:hypothetical protein